VINETLPVDVVTINAQLLHGEEVGRGDGVAVHVHDVEPPVDALAFVNLVGHDVVQNRGVVTLVAQPAIRICTTVKGLGRGYYFLAKHDFVTVLTRR
jgi:hypothetical protein